MSVEDERFRVKCRRRLKGLVVIRLGLCQREKSDWLVSLAQPELMPGVSHGATETSHFCYIAKVFSLVVLLAVK